MRATILCARTAFAVAWMAIPHSGSAMYAQEVELALSGLASEGQSALEQHQFAEAMERFERGFEIASSIASSRSAARFLFLLGRTSQESVAYESDSTQARATLEEAVRYYERARKLQPDSGAILNNLARSYQELGQTDRAAALYRQAIELGDENQATYLTNYGDLLAESSDSQSVARAYRELIKLDPENRSANDFLVMTYLEQRSDQLAGYLWELVEGGQVLRAQDVALQALELEGFTPQKREELLAVLALSLARQSYVPTEWLESEAARSLRRLESDPQLGQGALALLALHERTIPREEAEWWARGASDHDPDLGVWPRDAFRELSRSLGVWYKHRGEYGIAEGYFGLAATIVPDEVDPKALRDLTHAYLEQGQLTRVEELAQRYEPELFAGKGDAYRAGQLEKIYEYHSTLGEVYAYLNRWGEKRTVNSAVYQLEHARETARVLEQRRQAPEDGPEKLLFGPELADLLARSYLATGDSIASYHTRIEAAERYERTGNLRAASEVLRPIRNVPPSKVDVIDRPRLEMLKVRVPPVEEARIIESEEKTPAADQVPPRVQPPEPPKVQQPWVPPPVQPTVPDTVQPKVSPKLAPTVQPKMQPWMQPRSIPRPR